MINPKRVSVSVATNTKDGVTTHRVRLTDRDSGVSVTAEGSDYDAVRAEAQRMLESGYPLYQLRAWNVGPDEPS